MDSGLSNRGCFFLDLSGPQQDRIRKEDVHELKSSTKQTLLRDSVDSIFLGRDQAASTLERLKEFSPKVAKDFSIKADTVDDLVMRVYSHCNVEQNFSSYIALSYCWRLDSRINASWDIAENIATNNFKLSLPIPSSLFQAFLNERASESEGVWCDQICIDQSNELEKRVAIGLMDVIYKEARRVIVALDDIEIDLAEEEFLRRYIETFDGIELNDETRRIPRLRESPPNLHSLRVLIRLHEKILGARWFTRAWCAHEMRMGKRHAFLVQCKHVEGRPITVFRFDGSFLLHMICLAAEFPNHRDITSIRVNLRNRMNVIDGLMKRGQRNNHLDTFTQVFMLDAGGSPKLPLEQRILDANREKLAIVLNSVGTGLTIRYPSYDCYGKPPATHNECFRIISTLALAANNAAVLCTSGVPFQSDHSPSTNSWLRWPTVYDEDNMSTCGRTRIDVSQILVDAGPGSETGNVRNDIFVHSFAWTTEERDQLDLIMKFGYYIFEKCLHRPWDPQPILSATPYIVPDTSGGPHLIFRPSSPAVTAVIPTALLADEYADLPRVWYLSREVVNRVPQFELRGRSRIFGASLSHRTATQQVQNLKIYGPSK
ncbi:hypothetical protein MMC11_006504 [Xylographa trunciseda]|nr:hypothetical protein [Xylographa trunciseda]